MLVVGAVVAVCVVVGGWIMIDYRYGVEPEHRGCFDGQQESGLGPSKEIRGS